MGAVLSAAAILASCSDDPQDAGSTPTVPQATQSPSVSDGGAATGAGTASEEASETAAAATETPTVEPTPVAGIAPTVAPEELAAQGGESVGDEGAAALIAPVLEVGAEALKSPTAVDQDSLVSVAEGAAVEAMLASAAEFADNGWRQIGVPVVVSAEVTSLEEDADPPQAVVSACLDHSDVDIVDSSGESVVDPNARTRALNTLVLNYVDERWVLVERSFPDDVSC
jgi:hypothetical protein